MGIRRVQAELARKKFINMCLLNDKRRLETEVNCEGVQIFSDIPYMKDESTNHLLDYYLPKGFSFETDKCDKAFLVIHGGGLVYGTKELDRCFSTYLVGYSGIPVMNVNYSLIQENGLCGMLQDIIEAISFVKKEFGIRKIHLVGDSAGAYLALLVTGVMHDKNIRSDSNTTVTSKVHIDSVNLISGMFRLTNKGYPDRSVIIYEANDAQDFKAPNYAFDLGLLVKRIVCPRATIITRGDDYLKEDSIYMHDLLLKEEVKSKFYCAETVIDVLNEKDIRIMAHVYPIANPTWLESRRVISMITANANRL